jgi:hypothetical protein
MDGNFRVERLRLETIGYLATYSQRQVAGAVRRVASTEEAVWSFPKYRPRWVIITETDGWSFPSAANAL